MPDDQIQPEPEPRRRNRDDRVQNEAPDEERPRRSRRDEDEDEDDDIDSRRFRKSSGVETLIPYRNPKGLIAYYLGVFSLIPCAGLFLGPAALILGILGVSYSKKHPTAGGVGHAIAGIVLGAVTTLGNWGFVTFALLAGLFA
jgi:hypothetical protein